jgi:hypothetical protein
MQALLVPYSLTSFDLALDQYGGLVAEMWSSCYYIIVLHDVEMGLFHEVYWGVVHELEYMKWSFGVPSISK